ASNLIMAQGVGQAIAENKLSDKVKVIGFDSDDKTLGFLKSGAIAGLVVQDPYRMGYDGIKTALAVSKGEKVEANVDTGANLVTKSNMSDPKIDALINPKVK
ncbi:MAG: substrate-binding domain-containing protein, partial [Rhizobiaceae bacterium]|nr:substrate-binding domain-containing protein [Rhizobiaceae bacterium]